MALSAAAIAVLDATEIELSGASTKIVSVLKNIGHIRSIAHLLPDTPENIAAINAMKAIITAAKNQLDLVD